MEDNEWQDDPTFYVTRIRDSYKFTSRYHSIETPENGYPTYGRTLPSKNVNCNKDHACKYSHISISSFLFIFILSQKYNKR